MAIYIKQINKRRHLEKTLLAEALDRGAQRLGFLRKKNAIPQTSQSALRQLLEALGIKDYDLEENDIVSPEEQLTSILRPGSDTYQQRTGLSLSRSSWYYQDHW